MAETQSVAVEVSCLVADNEEHLRCKPLQAGPVMADTASDVEAVNDSDVASSSADVGGNVLNVKHEQNVIVPVVSTCTSIVSDMPLPSQTASANPSTAMLMNHHLVLKQLPSGQLSLTFQSMEPNVLEGSSIVIASGQASGSSPGSVNVVSCSAPDMSNSQSLLQVAGAVQTPEMCVEGSACCLVCGDKGSGFHYSVFSCEGCKGFFKRSVQRNMVYACKETGVCDINKMTRNNCQHCRFRRCLEAGMKKEAVREDRTPGGKHRAKKLRVDDSDVSTTTGSGGVVIDWKGCEQEEQLLSRLLDTRPDAVNAVDDMRGITSSTGQVVVKEFMQLICLELRCIIEWAKRVPGFLDLVSEDQMALLKSSFMELSLLRLSYRSLDCVTSLRFCNSLIMSASQCRNLGWGDHFVTCAFEFVSQLRTISVDNTEFCVLCAIVLTFPDAGGLVNRPSVLTLHNTWLDLLQKYSLGRYPDNRRRCGRILLRLLSLRSISAKAADKFLSCAVDVDVKMSDIVQEMIS